MTCGNSVNQAETNGQKFLRYGQHRSHTTLV
jgi:hypothetical protein